MAIKASDTITVVRIADGTSVTITSTSVEYQKSSSGTATPSTWQSTIPNVPAGQYLWTKTTVYYSNGKSTVSYSVAKQGSTGASGKGIKSTAITYAKGSSNTTAPSSGWQSSVPVTDATNKYLWTKTIITYTDNTTSTSYTVGSTLDGVSVGGRNLFLTTNVQVVNNKYKVNEYKPANGPLVSGKTYTVTLCVTPAEGVSCYRLYFSQGYCKKADLFVSGTSEQTVSVTFVMGYSSGRFPTENASFAFAEIYRFPNDGTVTGESTIHWVKIEEGNVATDWTPAPEDAVAAVKQQYYLSTSTASATGGAWSNTVPELKENTCIWTRTATIYGSGDVSYSTPILDSVTKKVVQTAADIKQTNTDLSLVASRTSTLESGMTDAKKRLDAAEASIKVNADAIELKVSKNGIVSAINQTSESIKIQASKISLEGLTTINNLFKVNTDGSIEATNATISGNITASSGIIGGWTIGEASLTSTNSKGNIAYIGNGTGDSQDVLWVRTGAGTDADPYKWPIILRATGQAIFNNATITGGIHATAATIDELIKMKDMGGSTVTVLSAGVSIDDPHSLWINPWGEIDTVRINGPGIVEVGGGLFNVDASAAFASDVQIDDKIKIVAHAASYISALQGDTAIDMYDNANNWGYNALARIKTNGGAWTIGAVNGEESFRICYGTDTRINAGTNGYDAELRVQKDGTVVGNGFASVYCGNSANLRCIGGDYGFLIRNDGNSTFFLLTNAKDQYGGWRGCYPFYIRNSDGRVFLQERTEAKNLYFNDWSGTLRKPASSANGDGNQVAYLTSRSGGSLGISGQYGESTFTVRTINTSSSDIRLKTGIKPSTISGLGLLRRIQMKQFDWIDTGKHQCIGFIADELEQLDPELSLGGGYDEDGNMDVKTVNDFYLMGYAVKSIQELDTETSVQKDRIRTLESQLDTVRVILEQAFERIAKLEKQL